MNLNDMKAKLKDRLDLFRQVWPYLKHPSKIALLEERYEYLRLNIHKFSTEAMKDNFVQILQQELDARKAAYDESEAQYEQDLEDLEEDYEYRIKRFSDQIVALRDDVKKLESELSNAYANNAKLCAARAEAVAEAAYLRALQTTYAVSTTATSADR